MTRPTRALIDLEALRANYRLARRIHGGRAVAVIKANAYGHGALACARALAEDADAFAVAFLDEARELREGGVRNPILLLEGVFSGAELELASELGLWLVVHHDEQIRMVEQARLLPRSLTAWLKIDSGMHRAGFDSADAARAYRRLDATGKVRAITLMTHFARAEELRSSMTTEQIERFDMETRGLPGERSLCNSAGLLNWPQARRDWARPGIMLYGIAPDDSVLTGLQPVMTFRSCICAVRTVQPGDAIGYGATFVADKPMRIGLVCAGYADGYPQTAPSGTPVAVDGQRTSLVGRVSMDLLMVDITDLPSARIGSEVELWGRHVHVSEVAKASGRIGYELVCNVKRAPFEYVDVPASRVSCMRVESATA